MLITLKMRYAISVMLLFGTSTTAAKENLRRENRNLQTCSGTDVDVLIIGAGMAGLGAARELKLFNDMNSQSQEVTYKVIEAANYHGGRMIAARWIAGGAGNPLHDMALKHEVTYDTQNWSDIEYYDERGRLLSYRNVRKDLFAWEDAFVCLQQKAFEYQAGGASYSDGVRGVLENQCGWDNNSGLRDALEYYELDWEFAQVPENISLWGFPLGPYGVFQDKDFFISDPRGYRVIAEKEFEDYGLDVELETEVEEVDWNKIPATVKTKNSSSGQETTYCANKVISTVSVGVLQNRGGDNGMFNPPLPATKMTAMNNLYNMALYMDIVFQFDEKFWGDTQFIQISLPSGKRGRCSLWQNWHTAWSNEFFYGSNAIVCTIVTEVIEDIKDEYGSVSQVAVNDLLQESLGEVYSISDYDCIYDRNLDKSNPPSNGCKYRFFDHSKNERWYGSYENWKLGGTLDDFKEFGAPLASGGTNITHIAGSATCLEHWGYTHGAYYSGIRAGNQVLRELRPSASGYPNTEQLCDGASSGGGGGKGNGNGNGKNKTAKRAKAIKKNSFI